MNIAFDVDGVLANFEKNVKMVSDEIFPGRMPEGYVPQDWDYTDIFNKKDWNSIWDRIYQIPDFWQRQPEISEAVKALKEFRMINKSPIWFITSRQATGGISAKYQTQMWFLSRSLIGIGELDNVIAVSKPEEKRYWMELLNINVSIDDLGGTVARHNEIYGHKAYLLDQPWNKKDVLLPRVYSVKEFLEKIS